MYVSITGSLNFQKERVITSYVVDRDCQLGVSERWEPHRRLSSFLEEAGAARRGGKGSVRVKNAGKEGGREKQKADSIRAISPFVLLCLFRWK